MTGNCEFNEILASHTPNQGRLIINDNFEKVCQLISSAQTSQVEYTNTNPTPITIGGINAGSTFVSQNMQEMFDLLLYPYQVPSFITFGRTNLITTYEVGQPISIGNQTFNWDIINTSNVQPNSISITQNVPSTQILASNLNPSPNTIAINLLTPISYTANTNNQSIYTISGLNTNNQQFSLNIFRSWRFKLYFGTSNNTSLDEVGIKNLISSPLASNFTGSYNFQAGGYKYFCYPSSFGTATIFKDSLTNLDVAMENPTTVSVTNNFGVTENYRVHRTVNVLGASITIIVS
jgi:hypothetical protein